MANCPGDGHGHHGIEDVHHFFAADLDHRPITADVELAERVPVAGADVRSPGELLDQRWEARAVRLHEDRVEDLDDLEQAIAITITTTA